MITSVQTMGADGQELLDPIVYFVPMTSAKTRLDPAGRPYYPEQSHVRPTILIVRSTLTASPFIAEPELLLAPGYLCYWQK